jgi:hypothetical protein
MAVSNVLAPIRIVFTVVLFFVCVNAQAQRDDWHMFSHSLLAKSAFAHGYMHGYEQGFHNGDVDVQMGRLYRDVKSQPEFKKISGFRAQYGDKGLFEEGYRIGFLVAYTDCYAGRNFRAVQLLDNAGQNNQVAADAARFDRNFDHAFREGYSIGQRQGLADGRNSDVTRLDPATCQVQTGHDSVPAEYCDAFRHGYRLGYSDGFTNQRGSADVMARNSKER